ncbi:MAG: hypothetical protein ACMG6E_00280 [Candidatus Roizmanbacteria bacterium]
MGAIFTGKKSHYHQLKKVWAKRHRQVQKELWTKHKDHLEAIGDVIDESKKHIAAGSLAGLIFLSQPLALNTISQNLTPVPISTPGQVTEQAHTRLSFLHDLRQELPDDVAELSDAQKKKVSQMLSDYYTLPISHQLEGIELNRQYGYIGAEQHLMRYPGDTISSHFQTETEAKDFAKSGMAPGRGAWGYFSPSRAEISQKEIDREKYYIAVQTFLAPGWERNVRRYSQFFKYRKMIVLNPYTGRAMIVVIGDAGPGRSTKKQLGGSPEVMDYLGRVDGKAKGGVLYFFVDDPTDTIPLGPLSLQ